MKRLYKNRLSYELLESRRVLAGGVQVLVHDSILLVVGDSANNQVEVSQNASGRVVVSGIDTLINGTSGPFVVDGGMQHMTISMNGGADEVRVTGVSVASNFSFFGGEGNDRLITSGLSARHFHAEGNRGDDVFEVNFDIKKSAYLYLGEGNDIVSSGNMIVGRNLKIFGESGDNTVSSNALTVGRKLELHFGSGADSVLMSGDTSVRNYARINLGAGNDFFGLLPAQNSGQANFRRSISVNGGAGNDSLAFDSAMVVRGSFKVDGGSGADGIQWGGSNPRQSKSKGIENADLGNVNALVDQVFTRLQNAGIGEEAPFEPLVATAATTELSFVENSSSTAVDSTFRLTGSSTVTGATIVVGSFEAGQDILSFTAAGNITGSFDSATGVMSLTGNASVASYQAAIRSVMYRNTSDDPLTDLRQFNFTVTTADESVSVSRNLTVIAINDAPEVNFSNANQTINPDELPVVIDGVLTVVDPDNTNLSTATVSIVSGFVQGDDTLSSQDANGISASYNATTGVLTLTGDASVADWQSVLRSVTYTNENSSPTEGVRTIRFTVNDGETTGSSDVQLNLQEDAQPNNFELSETVVNGTTVGQITTAGTFDSPSVFQISNDQISQVLLLNADDHFSGDPSAAVVLIEYLDFQCPNCAFFHPIVKQLEADFGGELLVVRRHLPLESVHPNARGAALAAEAADRQGMFDEMADLLFANQDDWNSEADPTSFFEGYATSLGLNLTQFRADVADADVDARVTRDASEAAGIGIQSTASFILEGDRITNPTTAPAFDQVIESAVAAVDDPFAINRETGEITVRDTTLLDAANQSTFTIPVLVSDANGNTETVTVTINVTA